MGIGRDHKAQCRVGADWSHARDYAGPDLSERFRKLRWSSGWGQECSFRAWISYYIQRYHSRCNYLSMLQIPVAINSQWPHQCMSTSHFLTATSNLCVCVCMQVALILSNWKRKYRIGIFCRVLEFNTTQLFNVVQCYVFMSMVCWHSCWIGCQTPTMNCRPHNPMIGVCIWLLSGIITEHYDKSSLVQELPRFHQTRNPCLYTLWVSCQIH